MWRFMSDSLRVYYYSIFGAFGGLTGWFLTAFLLPESGGDSVGYRMLNGALLGAPICGAISAYDGMVSRSFIRLMKFILLGLMLGTVAGVVALPAAQAAYAYLLPRLSPRVGSATAATTLGILIWVFFGGLIGFVGGLSKGEQFYKGLLGGGLGGLTGGLIYELMRTSNNIGATTRVLQVSLAFSLALLGGFIGASIALMTTTIRRAWIEVLTGKFAGHVYDVTKYVNRHRGTEVSGIIGSDERRVNIYLTADLDVLPIHARIGYANGVPTLTVLHGEDKSGTTNVNGRRASTAQLKDGDRIQIGSAMLIYRSKSK
jgi:hypothetical protein